jgi:hypothetical protein
MGFAAQVPLVVPAGVPLRLYLTKRIPKKIGAPVQARLLDPVWAFDRQVIPAGAGVLGRVSRLQGISGRRRAMTILNGDFTRCITPKSSSIQSSWRMGLDWRSTPRRPRG